MLTTVASAEPRAGRQTFEVDAGPAVFALHDTNGGVDPAAAFRISVGRYSTDDFGAALQVVDHAVLHSTGATRELDNVLSLMLAAKYWVGPRLFVELGGGISFGNTGLSPGEPLGGWTVAARGGFMLDDNLVLSAQAFHTWVDNDNVSTDAFAVLLGWTM